MKYKYPQEVVDFLRGESTIITTAEGNEYMFLPFWFKTSGDDPLIMEQMSLDGKLPDDLVNAINEQRNPISDNRGESVLSPITGHPDLFFAKYTEVKGTNPDGTPNGFTFRFAIPKLGPDGGIL